ncbi:uncharacterized protein LOC135501826 [Lineus longissimus]|uniref:uncharacterized protein LOC135501826 n=1 Tax=Lineus longissimus TaxID=88925 RepID=UPI002B4EA476
MKYLTLIYVLVVMVTVAICQSLGHSGKDGVDATEQFTAIREINLLRKKETKDSTGGQVPDVEWDANLASIADVHVRNCYYPERDDPDNYDKYIDLGGTGTVGSLKTHLGDPGRLKDALDLWDDEGYLYNYDTQICVGGTTCNNYLQLVNRGTKKMGCARGLCGGYHYIVCLFNEEYDILAGGRPF